MSQTKLFVHVEEAVHHLSSVSIVSSKLMDVGAYLSADCRDLEGFQVSTDDLAKYPSYAATTRPFVHRRR